MENPRHDVENPCHDVENPRHDVENGGDTSVEKVESMAAWLGMSIASAFFASLERFSCINLSTNDMDDEIEKESDDLPLVLSAKNSYSDYHGDDPEFGHNFTTVWAPPSN